ncbi:MAG: 30S ribosomal protein S3 [Candidatus Omnitrophica bacterium]|nr:30S ribosomal protein S3 [Candidatus Omnitrophota bacterium]
MGQKVHPYIQRIGINKNWRSLWYADRKEYTKNVIEDRRIRQYITKQFVHASVSYVVVERVGDKLRIKIASARPGVVIGRRGADIDKLKEELTKITKKEVDNILVDVIEIKAPAKDAQLVAQNICFQLEKRVAFRRAVKRSMDIALQNGVLGIKISVAGRLGGAEMSRRETYREGSIPLQTLRADLDYGFAEALTTYGLLGVKVWIYHGEIIREKNKAQANKAAVVAVPQPQEVA